MVSAVEMFHCILDSRIKCSTHEEHHLFSSSYLLIFHHFRQDAAGIFNSTAYVGNILAPWVVQYARNAHYTLPMLILGSVALIGSFVMCRFPETMGKQLPESFENLLRRPTSRVSSQAGSDEKMELQEPVA